MPAATDHPFKSGTQVAIVVQNGWRSPHSFKPGIVAKVLKSGRFTLEGSPQQYRAYGPSTLDKYWHAVSTGSAGVRVRILDETTKPEIELQNAKARRAGRYEAARIALGREPFSELVTDDVIAHLEAVIAAIKPKKEVA